MTKLRVLAGPNANELTPISHLVNTSKAHRIKSDRFDGLVCVHVKGFVGTDGKMKESAYFNETDNENGNGNGGMGGNGNGGGADRKGVTWSIQVTGRFLVDGLTSDDVLFGNTFDRPLKLPWGSGAALKFMNFVDPTLEHALDSDKPWALSPLISTMPYFAITPSPKHPPKFEENSTPFHQHLQDDTSSLSSSSSLSAHSTTVPTFKTPSSRRTYFANKSNRRAVPYHPSDIITTDFCYGFLSFPEIRLNIPGGISFDLMQYWDGQPVRFVCCERKREGEGEGGVGVHSSASSSVSSFDTDGGRKREGREKRGSAKGAGLKGPGDPFWVVVFEAVLDDHEEEGEGEVSGSSSAVTPDEEVLPRVPHPHAQVAHGHGPGAPQPKEHAHVKVTSEDQARLREDID